jgi:hypothetical protein
MTYGYAVVDTETTGLGPRTHRIIEIAAVGLRADGSVEDEWSTLLNPGRDLGRTDIRLFAIDGVGRVGALASGSGSRANEGVDISVAEYLDDRGRSGGLLKVMGRVA